MNKGIFASVAAALLLLSLSTIGMAATFDFDYEILSNYGGMTGGSPIIYDGVLLSGGDGTLTVTIDDTGWPDPSFPSVRFDSIWQNYFADNYDTSGGPGTYKWSGNFTGRFYLDVTNGPIGYTGTCEGSVNITISVRDHNENATLETWERDKQHLFHGRLAKLCEDPSTGEMACTRGFGSLNSNYFSFFPPDPPGIDTLYNGGELTLYQNCPSEAQPSSWGAIKSLYK
jgi:hypothetical protein